MSDFGASDRLYIQKHRQRRAETLRKSSSDKPVLKPEDLRQQCTEYLSQCDALQRRPTWQGLAGYAGVTSEALTTWVQEGGERSEVLKKAVDAISDRLQQRTDSMAVLSVKQPIYGGFLDKAQGGGDGIISVVVTVGGRGDKESADYGK